MPNKDCFRECFDKPLVSLSEEESKKLEEKIKIETELDRQLQERFDSGFEAGFDAAFRSAYNSGLAEGKKEGRRSIIEIQQRTHALEEGYVSDWYLTISERQKSDLPKGYVRDWYLETGAPYKLKLWDRINKKIKELLIHDMP